LETNAEHHSILHPDLQAPFKTEMSYLIEGETAGCNAFIVAFSLEKIPFTSPKLKFLQGVGYAIYVAAFDLDEHDESVVEQQIELDKKAFEPRSAKSVPAIATTSSKSAHHEHSYLENIGSGKRPLTSFSVAQLICYLNFCQI